MSAAPQPPTLLDLNGQIVAPGAPALSALDRGLFYGDGLYETLRAYGRQPFGLGRHLERLRNSAAALRIAESLDTRPIEGRLARLLRQAPYCEAYVRITLTRGIHTGALDLRPSDAPTVLILVRPLRSLPPGLYERGVDAIIASARQNACSILPRHKTLNYLEKLLAKTEARDRGAYEAIFLNTRGHVAEGASSSLFCVLDGRLVTPALDANILPGVTRREVLDLAREAAIPVDERTVGPHELRGADELFLTNAIVEALPVRTLDGRPVGTGQPGPLTRQLLEAYRARVQSCLQAPRSPERKDAR